jgi:hypothetical protein
MKKKIFFHICLTFIFVLSASAQIDTVSNPLEVVDTLQQDFGLFTNTEVLNLSLRFDITNYRRKKPKEEYMDGLLTYHINDKDSINKKNAIQINTYPKLFTLIRITFKFE